MNSQKVNLTLAVVTAVLVIAGFLETIFGNHSDVGFSLIIIGIALTSITMIKPRGKNNDTNTTK